MRKLYLLIFLVLYSFTSVFSQTAPNAVPGLKVWLDASDMNGNGSSPANGASVTTWVNKAGGVNAVAVSTTGIAGATVVNPTWNNSAINAMPAVNFPAAGSNVAAFSLPLDIRASAMPAVTIFTVYRQGMMAPSQAVWGNDNGGWDRLFLTNFGGANGGISNGTGLATVGNSGMTGEVYVLAATYDQGNASAAYFNGAQEASFTDNTHATDAIGSMGIGFDGDDNYFNGDIAEVLVYDRKLTICEIQSVNNYLSTRYGQPINDITNTASGPTTFCIGGSVMFTASASTSYQWMKDGVAIPGATNQTFIATQAGSYQVSAIGTPGCDPTLSAAQVVTLLNTDLDQPADLVACQGSVVPVTVFTGSATAGFSWTNSNTGIGLGASGYGSLPSFTAINTGTSPVTSTITVTPNAATAGANIYVANSGANSISVINRADHTLVTNISVGTYPVGLLVNGNGSILYVSNRNSNTVSVINTSTNTVSASVNVGGTPWETVLSKDGSKLYVSVVNTNSVVVINTFNNQVTGNIPVGASPRGMAISPDGTRLYVGNTSSSSLSVINTATDAVTATIATGNYPQSVAVSANGSRVYAGNLTSNSVSVINAATNSVIASIPVGSGPQDVLLSKDGSKLYVTNYFSNNISVINTATNAVNAVISNPGNPRIMALNEDGSKLYVTNASTNSVSIIQTSTGTNAGNFSVGSGPFGIALGTSVCTGPSKTFTITINPTPAFDPTGLTNTFCPGVAVNYDLSNSGTVAGTTYNWTNSNTAIGLAASGSTLGGLVINTTNSSTADISGTITVTPVLNGCAGTASSFTITVKPEPKVNTVTSQVLCNGATSSAITFSGAVPGTSFSWTNNTSGIGLAASGTGDIPAFTATNTLTTPVIATITVIPAANGCFGPAETFTITVNPTPAYDPAGLVTNHCHNTPATYQLSNGGNVAGATYNWTNSNTAIGLAASGSTTSSLSFTATNTGNTNITGTITVTPSANGCNGTPADIIVTVKPMPSVDIVSSQTLCNNSSTAAILFTGPVAGTSFSWTNNASSIGLPASGTGDISSFTAINTGTSPVVATITVTPSADGCQGPSRVFNITVNPTPAATIAYTGAPFCSTVGIVPASITGTTGGTFGSTAGLTIDPTTGSINTATSVAGTYTVTYSIAASGGCAAFSTTAGITITAAPSASFAYSGSPYCSGINTVTPVFSGTSGGSFSSTTGLSIDAATGAINIANSNAGTYTVTYTIAASAGCPAFQATASVTINPVTAAAITASGPTSFCQGGSVILSAPVAMGNNYLWSNGETTASITVSTTSNHSVTVTSAAGCVSVGGPVSVTVLPAPSATISGGAFCATGTQQLTITGQTGGSFTSGAGLNISATGLIDLAGSTPGTYTVTYNFTDGSCANSTTSSVSINPLPAAGISGSATICQDGPAGSVTFTGSGATAPYTFTYSINGGSPQTISTSTGNTVSVPVSTGIPGTYVYQLISVDASGTPVCSNAATGTATIVVNALPQVTSAGSGVICNAMAQNYTITSSVPGTTYNWSRDAVTGISNAAVSGQGSSTITETLVNTTNAAVNVIYQIQPTANGCAGPAFTYTVTVQPTTVVTSAGSLDVCGGNALGYNITGSVPGTSYSWSRASVSGISNPAVSGQGSNPINENLVNTTNAPVVTTYIITPSVNGCTGPDFSLDVTVHPAPSASFNYAGTPYCSGPLSATPNFSGTTGGTFSASSSLSIDPVTGEVNLGASVPGTYAVTYTIPATSVCAAFITTASITINEPVTIPVTASGPLTFCAGNSVTLSAPSGSGNTYQWSTGETTASIIANASGTYSFTMTNAGCFTNGSPVTVTVNPVPDVNPVSALATCHGSSTSSITFSGAVNGTVYSWTNSAPSIGLAASGTGEIASFTAVNNGTATINALITVTPSYTNNGITCTGTPISFTISVYPQPAVDPIANKVYCIGSNNAGISFSSAVSGTSFTWASSNDMGFGTSGTGDIPAFTANINGGISTANVTVVPTANGCTGAARIFTVTVNSLPAITQQPVAQVACKGSATTFMVGATGSGLTYQWRKNNIDIPGATSATYTIPNTALADSATSAYNVEVSGSCAPSVVSQSVSLTVNDPAAITVQPAPRTICLGESVTFAITATGTAVQYQWKKDGVAIAGATTNTLTISNATAADAANYTVVVSNSCVSVSSIVAALQVNTTNTWTGTVSSNWNDAANWCGGIPTATSDIMVPSGTSYPAILSASGYVRTVNISAGANVTVATGGVLNLYGNIQGAGNFTAQAGTVVFSGSSNQTIPALTIGHVVMNGAGGLTPGGHLNIINTLTLTNGNITLGNYNLVMPGGANGSVASHVITNGTGVFSSTNITAAAVNIPVAPNSNSYNPVQIANGGGRNFSVKVATGIAPAIGDPSRAINRTWEILPSAVSATPATVGFQYADADANSMAIPSAAMEIAAHNGSVWKILSPTIVGVNPTGTPAARQVQLATATFGKMVVGNLGSIPMTGTPNSGADITMTILLPNLIKDKSVLRVVATRQLHGTWYVYDAAGSLVMRFEKDLFVGVNDFNLFLVNLPPGAYFLQGHTGSGKIPSLRFIKY